MRHIFNIKPTKLSSKYNFTPFIKEHPYLPFVYKPYTIVPMQPTNMYEFMKDTYYFPEIRTNNKGHLNGKNGGRDVALHKSPDVIRVSTLGDSVSANYIRSKGVNYNFSVEIERILNESNSKIFEVNNCAIGGYTTLDILVKFLVKDIHEKPDYVVINHGYSNLRSYLNGLYQPDNTHFRRSFSMGESRYRIASMIPLKNFSLYKVLFSMYLPSDLKDFLKFISIGNFDIKAKWDGLGYFEKNLRNLLFLAFSNDIKVILCTCPHYLHNDIASSFAHNKFHEGMKIQNKIIRKVARETGAILVDNARFIKPVSDNFIDSIHLSPIGMQRAAQKVVEQIDKLEKC